MAEAQRKKSKLRFTTWCHCQEQNDFVSLPGVKQIVSLRGAKRRSNLFLLFFIIFFSLVLTPAHAASPTLSTVSPASGSIAPNTAKTFTSKYSDLDGWANLREAYLLISTGSTTLANAAYLYYNQNTNLLYLRNDANTAWLGGYTPGSANIIENSYVKLNCASTTVTGLTSTLTVNFNLTFKPAYSGKAYKTYLKVIDDTNLTINWTQKGSYTVNTPPIVGTVTPASGSIAPNIAQTFSTTYTDQDSWQNIQYVYFLVNTSTAGTNCLYAYYNQNTNKLYLRNDANTGWVGGYAPGAAYIIQNTYVKLDCAKTTLLGSTSTLTVNWNITAKPTFTGTKNTYLYVRDDVNTYQNWVQKGSVTIQTQGDITPPTGSIVINNNAQYTNTTTVTLTLSATDSDSGMGTGAQMQFSNDNITYSIPEAYAVTKSWALAAGDGTKTVYAKFKDIAGNWSQTISSTIILDTLAPNTTASGIDDLWHNNPVTITLNAADAISGVDKIYYSSDSTNPAILYAGPFVISNEGTHAVKYYAQDKAGNSESVQTAAFPVKIDKTAPAGNLKINNDALYAASAVVTLNLSASDNLSGVGPGAQMQLSDDGITYAVPEPYNTAKSWTLSSGDGEKRVYAKFMDAAGNWSNSISDTIMLDTHAPVIISSWPAKDGFVGSQGGSVTLNIVFGDATSGINPAQVKLSDESGIDITWSAQVSQNNIEYLISAPVNKQYKFKLYLEDNAGNSLLEEFAFTVDSTIPDISADTMGGTFAEPVTVKLGCSEQATIYYSTDGYPPIEGNANTTAVTGTSASITINKTTNLQFFAIDSAGNRSAVKTEIYRFNELPIPPSGLQGFYNETDKRVELQWQAAAGVSGYYVYRASNIQEINLLKDSIARKYPASPRLRISASLLAQNLFYDSNVLSATSYWYGVSIVDSQGKESPVSELVTVKVPAQQPTVDRKEAIKRALSWIEANQKSQGYWGDKTEIRMLTTSQILNALYKFYRNQQPAIWIRRPLFWLRGNFADNNDYLSRKILTLYKFGQNTTEEINRLIGESDLRGLEIYGWGVQKRYGNDALTTALGSQAISISSWLGPYHGKYDKSITDTNPPVLSSISLSQDGRYGWVPGKDTSIFVSSTVYYVIRNFKGLSKDVYRWIIDSQNPDGSFGNGLIDTTAALSLFNFGDISSTARTQAINYIISQQGLDGSWNNGDAYLTALCLETIIPQCWSGDWNDNWCWNTY